jgi:hypothetical protein
LVLLKKEVSNNTSTGQPYAPLLSIMLYVFLVLEKLMAQNTILDHTKKTKDILISKKYAEFDDVNLAKVELVGFLSQQCIDKSSIVV